MKTIKIITLLAVIFVASDCYAQFIDDFSDGNFTATPAWTGQTSKFTVLSGVLKLQAPAIGETAYLSTPSLSIHAASWQFYVQLDFTPSSTNLIKIYLVSDQSNLVEPLNGYFIKVGNTSRDISLYRQSGNIETRIIDGADDRVNAPIVKVRISVTRDEVGNWQLFSDVGATGSYVSEGIVVDTSHSSSSYFGIHCTYTATRSDKFWVDDIKVTGTAVPDTTLPTIISITTVGPQDVRLEFSESLDRSAAADPSNYLVADFGTPDVAVLQSDQRTVALHFSTEFTNGTSYSLQIARLKDLAGNTMIPSQQKILFFKALPVSKKDIIISELFPDPSPQLGLPAVEFVEIYNRSQNPIDLQGWKLSDGSSIAIFPSQIVLPGEYWIVTAASSQSLVTGFGKNLGLANFPTLNNSEDIITLKDVGNATIDSVHYTIDWYRDVDKQEGGWTLELIDPSNPCGEEDNWMASEDLKGGTPGKQNSVLANKPDLSAPMVTAIFPESKSRIELLFNEKLDPSSLSLENYSLEPSVDLLRATFKDTGLRTILLDLKDSLQIRKGYLIHIRNVEDCSGNRMATVTNMFGLPEKTNSQDVIINELLFNPRQGGVDFVEVQNISVKYLNMKNWKVGNGTLTNLTAVFSKNLLLPPGNFAVFTSDPSIIKLQYPQSVEPVLYKVSLPSLPDDEGFIALLDELGVELDKVEYSKDWHSVFLKEQEGVSLERINSREPSSSSANWTSSASVSGFATPGFINSQKRQTDQEDENDVIIVPEVFTPADGYNDFAQIHYSFDQGGWTANVRVLDQQQHVVKIIASNETIGPKGFFRWDGDREDGRKTRSGYCIVWFEIFNQEGVVRTFRKRVVVSAHP